MTKLTPSGRISKSLAKLNSKEHTAWSNIKSRCYNKEHKDYKNYGGRGIKMDDRWSLSFNAFLNDVGKAPGKEYTIDRINNNGNYERGNVRWATKKEQACNKRNTILITYLCRTRILGEWCEILRLRYGSLYKAIRTNEDTSPSDVFHEFIMSRIGRKYKIQPCFNKKIKIVKEKKDKSPRYYHDLRSVLIKHGLANENGVLTPRKTLNLRRN